MTDKYAGHTPGPFWFREFHTNDEDLALAKKHGIEPVQALSNEGQRYLMSGPKDDAKRIALVDCQSDYKRGKGHQTACAERDANARLLADAPLLLEQNRRLREALATAAAYLESMGTAFCRQNFTDRGGDGPRMKALAANARALLAEIGE